VLRPVASVLRRAYAPAALAMLVPMGALVLAGCPREQEQEPQYGYGQPPPPGYGQPYPAPYPQQPYPGQQPPPGATAPAPGAPPPAPGQPPPAPQPGAQPQPGWPFPFPQPGSQPAPQPGQPPPPASGDPTLATVLDPAAAAVATVPLTVLQQQKMQGMQPVTEVIAGDFKQGQRLEQNFQMTQGKCYGALSVGTGQISEMHIRFVALQPIPGIPNPVLAEDKGTGTQATLGAGGNCFKYVWPIGVNVRVEYIAQAGAGIAAGRVYAK
jgi:hypothetical protein